jgi:hypothetical protein
VAKSRNGISRSELQRQDEANKKLNLAVRMMEKVGLEENFNKQWTDFEVFEPRETTPTYKTQPAPTTNADRPRALKIAYSREARKLVVKFRDGTWWEYNDIPLRMWVGLKSSDSTGKYLKYSGLDSHDDMGPFNPNEMPPEVRVMFNS